MTELQINGIKELQKDRQGKSSIDPTFSKRGYNDKRRRRTPEQGYTLSSVCESGGSG